MLHFNFDFYELVVWGATLIMCFIVAVCKRIPLRKPGGIGQPLPNPIAVIIPIVFFVAMAGLRKNVGDTVFYAHSFELMGDENQVSIEIFFTSMFAFFQNIIRNFTDDPQYLIMFTAIFAVPVPLIILYKYSYPFEMGLFLFVAYGYIGGLMNGVRQYMAAAIVLCATKYLFSLKKSDFIKYAVIILLAYCMHNSALVMLPVYFVVRRRSWQIGSYLISLASVVGVVMFDAILPSFLGALEDTSYSHYAENGWFTSGEEGGSSIFRVLAALVPIVIAFVNKSSMRRLGHMGDIMINMAFLNAAIYMLAVYNWIFARVAIYMSIYFIILMTWVLSFGVKPRERLIYKTACIFAFFIYSRIISYMIAMYESDYFFPGRKLFK